MKSVKYSGPTVCVCWKCMGVGVLQNWDYLRTAEAPITCDQCGGTGRVTVYKKVELTIQPYFPNVEADCKSGK